MTRATHVNGWEPAVYISYMSQNSRVFLVSNLSIQNFRIFLLMYPGSLTVPRLHHSDQPLTIAIEETAGGGFRCQGEEQEHSSIQELLTQFSVDHLIQFKECLPPSEHGTVRAGGGGGFWGRVDAYCRGRGDGRGVVRHSDANYEMWSMQLFTNCSLMAH